MKTKDLIAEASVRIKSSANEVWDALTDPDKIREYMFGAEVTSQWREGSKIVWKGEFRGKPFEDIGTITEFKPGKLLQYTHFNTESGLEDKPENYHTVTTKLTEDNKTTTVELLQHGNKTEEERKHSEQNWKNMLESLKKFVEKQKVAA